MPNKRYTPRRRSYPSAETMAEQREKLRAMEQALLERLEAGKERKAQTPARGTNMDSKAPNS